MIGTKSHDGVTVVVEFHLVQPAGAKGGRLIIDTVMRATLHNDGIRAGRESGAGQESEHADQRQQDTNEALLRSRKLFQFFHADKLLFSKIV